MNTQNTKVNTILFRRELAKLGITSSDERQSIESFNTSAGKSFSAGKGWRKTRMVLVLLFINIAVSFVFSGLGKADIGLGVALGAAISLVAMWPNFREEKGHLKICERIVEDIQKKEQLFIAGFPECEDPIQWASTLKEAGKAHQFVLDYARMQVILVARKIKAGDESVQVKLKVMVAAAILFFGKEFARGQNYKLFFTEEIVSEMCNFRKELGYPEDGDSAKTE